MLLYSIDVQIRNSRSRFRLQIGGDDRFSEDGDWTALPPGHLYFGEVTGYWRLSRPVEGRSSGGFWLYDKEMPGAWKVWTWGDAYPIELAVLWIEKMGVILDQRYKWYGRTSILRGSWDFDWAVTRRFV